MLKTKETTELLKIISTVEMHVTEFIQYEPVRIQRNHEKRAAKLAKVLKKSTEMLPTLLEVKLVEFANGKRQIANGNTRKHIWINYEQFGIIAPETVIATIFKVNNENTADNIYLSIDSSIAVENSKHKIQGLFRKLGMNVTSPKISSGIITTALELASNFYKTEDDLYIRDNMESIIIEFREEILVLDHIMNPVAGGINTQPLIAACLMLLKKYGAHNKKIYDIICALKAEEHNSNGKVSDGLHFIKYELPSPSYLASAWKSTSADTLPLCMNSILYCLEKQVRGEMFSKIGKSREVAYRNFFEDEE